MLEARRANWKPMLKDLDNDLVAKKEALKISEKGENKRSILGFF